MRISFNFSPREYPLLTIILGVVFTGIGIFILIQDIQFRNTGIETYAHIVEIRASRHGADTRWDVFVSYEVDGISHEQELGFHSSGMRVGDRVRIRYMPDDPTEIRAVTGAWLSWFVMIVGSGTVIAGLRHLPLFKSKKRIFRIAK